MSTSNLNLSMLLNGAFNVRHFEVATLDDGFLVGVERELVDPDTALRPAHLGREWNDIAVGRRLTQAAAMDAYGIPVDAGMTIASIAYSSVAQRSPDARNGAYRVQFADIKRRGARVEQIHASCSYQSANVHVMVTFVFGILPSSVVHFVRKGRGFTDYADIAMPAELTGSEMLAEGGHLYRAGEQDRLIDGKRADHVPAVVVARLMFDAAADFVDPGVRSINITFHKYLDPRYTFTSRVERSLRQVTLQQHEEPTMVCTFC